MSLLRLQVLSGRKCLPVSVANAANAANAVSGAMFRLRLICALPCRRMNLKDANMQAFEGETVCSQQKLANLQAFLLFLPK
ncbi:hypothetical protein GCM10010913_23080 [Paenibacillus aceti]|uniref:Secreted protein n=2 Tax=Paenibacillus aceti TaxID=1820010 RepID=A0ABQ1VVF6_9BACL|nr:hypothetical protein [Paenibacillus aceti]GGG00689.1 hypothetical protein GCM10010913_23080 [Paenibacillus aceti]